MQKIIIREPITEDKEAFIAAMQNSRALHYPWIEAPITPEKFKEYIQRYKQANQKSFLICDQGNNIIGVFNINEIVRGLFQNAYLGFYAVADFAGKGYMSVGL